jgi:hypothetical protein
MDILKAFFENNLPIAFFAVFILLLLILIWLITLQLTIKRTREKSAAFFAGKQVQNIEELLLKQEKNLKILDKDIQELYNISNQINNLAFRGYHKIGMVRFNPFKDVGGDQSFALAILNGKNNGITLSSLYTREGTRVYCKSITQGESDKHPLTEEEKEAIQTAIASKKELLVSDKPKK